MAPYKGRTTSQYDGSSKHQSESSSCPYPGYAPAQDPLLLREQRMNGMSSARQDYYLGSAYHDPAPANVTNIEQGGSVPSSFHPDRHHPANMISEPLLARISQDDYGGSAMSTSQPAAHITMTTLECAQNNNLPAQQGEYANPDSHSATQAYDSTQHSGYEADQVNHAECYADFDQSILDEPIDAGEWLDFLKEHHPAEYAKAIGLTLPENSQNSSQVVGHSSAMDLNAHTGTEQSDDLAQSSSLYQQKQTDGASDQFAPHAAGNTLNSSQSSADPSQVGRSEHSALQQVTNAGHSSYPDATGHGQTPHNALNINSPELTANPSQVGRSEHSAVQQVTNPGHPSYAVATAQGQTPNNPINIREDRIDLTPSVVNASTTTTSKRNGYPHSPPTSLASPESTGNRVPNTNPGMLQHFPLSPPTSIASPASAGMGHVSPKKMPRPFSAPDYKAAMGLSTTGLEATPMAGQKRKSPSETNDAKPPAPKRSRKKKEKVPEGEGQDGAGVEPVPPKKTGATRKKASTKLSNDGVEAPAPRRVYKKKTQPAAQQLSPIPEASGSSSTRDAGVQAIPMPAKVPQLFHRSSLPPNQPPGSAQADIVQMKARNQPNGNGGFIQPNGFVVVPSKDSPQSNTSAQSNGFTQSNGRTPTPAQHASPNARGQPNGQPQAPGTPQRSIPEYVPVMLDAVFHKYTTALQRPLPAVFTSADISHLAYEMQQMAFEHPNEVYNWHIGLQASQMPPKVLQLCAVNRMLPSWYLCRYWAKIHIVNKGMRIDDSDMDGQLRMCAATVNHYAANGGKGGKLEGVAAALSSARLQFGVAQTAAPPMNGGQQQNMAGPSAPRNGAPQQGMAAPPNPMNGVRQQSIVPQSTTPTNGPRQQNMAPPAAPLKGPRQQSVVPGSYLNGGLVGQDGNTSAQGQRQGQGTDNVVQSIE